MVKGILGARLVIFFVGDSLQNFLNDTPALWPSDARESGVRLGVQSPRNHVRPNPCGEGVFGDFASG